MAKCCRCGGDAWPNRRVCRNCVRKWRGARLDAYRSVVAAMGEITAENQTEFKRAVVRETKRNQKAMEAEDV